MRIFVYTNSPVFLIKKGEPGCLVKGEKGPKIDCFFHSYLIINKLILFKVLKTAQNCVKIC